MSASGASRDERVGHPRAVNASRVLRRAQVVAWVLVLLALPVAWWLRVHARPPAPVLGALPELQLTDDRGRPFTLASLRGRVWVADFIFTSCPSSCPRLTAYLRRVQDRTRRHGDAVGLVSFSVDPEVDTPERLRGYAARHGADPARWRFVTGDLGMMQRTVVHGFKIHMEAAPHPSQRTQPLGIMDIAHGNQLVLLDRHARLRGYFHADDGELDALLGAVQDLTREP
ncbi:MAG: SCO family protein [Deltaproteobacteria bacterium]|nr:SCO family protein [Deltaproteobacteria bacterium]